MIICILNSIFTIPTVIIDSTDYISTWFEMTALAAIGLRLDFRKFIKEGPRFLVYGLSVGVLQTVAAVAFIYILQF